MKLQHSALLSLGLICLGVSHTFAQEIHDDTALEEVVISGEKLARSEINTTGSVGLRTDKQIEASSAATLDNVITQMANVVNDQNLTIRGIPMYGASGSADGGKVITITLDGIAQEGIGQGADTLSVWDTQQVEVLRGPQSTNQGRNALAGAIIMKTIDPTDVWDWRARASLGNHDTFNLALAGGGPLIDDLLSFRLAAERRDTAGEAYNETLDNDRYAFSRYQTLRGKLRLTPGDNYQAVLTLSEQVRKSGADEYVESTKRDPEDRVSFANLAGEVREPSRNAALEQTFSVGALDFTLLSTWQEDRYDRWNFDYDRTEQDQGFSTSVINTDMVTHEARMAFEFRPFGHALRGVAGVYYSDYSRYNYSNYTVPVSYVLTIFGMCPDLATCEALYPNDFVNRIGETYTDSRNHAAFAEIDFELAPVTLTLGGRYDREQVDDTTISQLTGTTPTATAVTEQLIAYGQVAPDGTVQVDTDYSAWLPKAGLRYQINANWSTGVVWQRGYRTGGVVYSYQRGPTAYAPEFTDNYEWSIKGTPLPALNLNLNVYQIDWRDQQVNLGANFLDTYIVNAGRSRLRGAELEARGKVRPQLEVFAALGLSRTEYLEFVSPSGDYTGNEFANSPRHTASLGATWTPGAWTINGNVTNVGSTYSSGDNDPDARNRAHTVVDAKLARQFGKSWQAFAYANNVFDEFYTIYTIDTVANRQAVMPAKGRQVGIGVDWRFQ